MDDDEDPLSPEWRSRVNRILDELVDQGLIERTDDDGYVLTRRGWLNVQSRRAAQRGGELMEGGDLGTWVDHGIIVILEGYLAQVPPPTTKGRLKRGRVTVWAPPEEWVWSGHAMKVINDKAYRMSLPIEVVTFLSPDVGDMAADWLSKYAVSVSDCVYADFDTFCASLTWRPNVQFVIDSDADRLHHYGQRGYQATWGGEF